MERNPDLRGRIVSSLITQLQTANSLVSYDPAASKNLPELPEGFGDYHGDLIEAVSSLDDESAIPVMLDSAGMGGMATSALARFGDRILPIAITRLGSARDKLTRASWLQVISKMTTPEFSSSLRNATSKDQIARVLLNAARDDDRMIRQMAVNGMQWLADRADVRQALQHVAQTDPYSTDDGRFLVRQAASSALRDATSLDAK